jgi:hypothetical protein
VSEASGHAFSGRAFTADEIALMREVVETCGGRTPPQQAHPHTQLRGGTRPRGGVPDP